MNDLQKVEFEILNEFIRVCDTLQLRFYLVCGSALGAVKYHGFIPWDDDVDVALERNDYEVFIAKAQQLLPDNIFVQNYHTDPAFPKIFTKLRRSDTTFIEKSSAHLPINHGVFIDVFPLDGYPEDRREQVRLEKLKKKYMLRLSSAFRFDYNLKAKLYFAVERLFGVHKKTAVYVKKLDSLVASYDTATSSTWCNHGNWQKKLDYTPKEWFGKGTKELFEGIEVIVPENADAYLSRKYGDWRADLPEEHKKGHHGVLICDTCAPYTRYPADTASFGKQQ